MCDREVKCEMNHTPETRREYQLPEDLVEAVHLEQCLPFKRGLQYMFD